MIRLWHLGNGLENDLGDGLSVVEVNGLPFVDVVTHSGFRDFGFPVGWIDVWDNGEVYLPR